MKPLKTTISIMLTLASFVFFSGVEARAYNLLVDGDGYLTGIDEVDINGTLYDVTFKTDSAQELYYDEGTDTWSFDFSSGMAQAASTALMAIINSESTYDLDPWLVYGMRNTSASTRIMTPYGTHDYNNADGLHIDAWTVQNYGKWDEYDSVGNWRFSATLEADPETDKLSDWSSFVYASWSEQTSTVPVPGSLSLLGLGLLGLTGVRRRIKA